MDGIVTRMFVLTIALSVIPKPTNAKIINIPDSGKADSRLAGQNLADPYRHVIYNFSPIPGGGWDFNYGFGNSSAAFQWQVDVAVIANDTAKAGHNHSDPPPKLFYYPNWPDRNTVARLDGTTIRSPQLVQDQRFHVHMAPVAYATDLTVRGSFAKFHEGITLKPTLTDYLHIKTPGIAPMPADDRLYKLAGATRAHPENHYASTTTITALMNLAEEWRNAHPSAPLLEIGNISLPWGGAFDVKGDWKADNMHHAYGIAADIGKTGFSSSERAALIKLMCGSGFYVYSRPEGGVEQFHVVHRDEFRTLKQLDWPVKLPVKAEGAVNCCAAKAGSPAWQKCAAAE